MTWSGAGSVLVVMCGISCSGKSTAAEKLRDALDAVLVSTDLVRKHSDLNKVSLSRHPLERYVVYYRALKKAEELLQHGRHVIMDGTFILRILRQAAYYTASNTCSNAFLVHCFCNNYGLIQHRYGLRQKNNNMFDAWQKIEGHNVKYLEFENLDKEVMPDGRPVPIIRNDTEKSKAEIVYSDGSETMGKMVRALTRPAYDNNLELMTN